MLIITVEAILFQSFRGIDLQAPIVRLTRYRVIDSAFLRAFLSDKNLRGCTNLSILEEAPLSHPYAMSAGDWSAYICAKDVRICHFMTYTLPAESTVVRSYSAVSLKQDGRHEQGPCMSAVYSSAS